ncbi:Bone morphoproteintic protein 1 [Sparganum proliferum]
MYTASTFMIIALLLIFGAATSFAASTRALNIDQHAKKRSEEKVHTSRMNVHVEKIGLNPAAAASSTKSTNSIGYAMEREVEDRSANASYLSQLKYVYLEIITENIKPENLHNFDKKEKDEINSLNETYDYDSVMHYSSTTFVKSGANETMRPIAFGPLPKIGHKVRPSEGDARQVNKLYKCPSIGCGGYLKSDNGDFSSPEFPDWYPPNSKCVYNIEVSLGFSIVLTFESFEISEVVKLTVATVMHSGLLILLSLSAAFGVRTHVSNTIELLSDSDKEKVTLPAANIPQQTANQFPVAEDNPQYPINTIDSGAQNEAGNRRHQTMPKTGTTAEQELQTTSQNTLDTEGRASEDAKQRSRRAVTSRKSHLWPSGIIPYEIEPLFSSSSRTIILTAMRMWENVTCVTFVEREPHHQSYLIFTVEKCGCCSNVGRQNEDRPQTISIAPSCESVRTVVHELGHAMGFWHEQSRPDRDAYVEILTENIKNDRLYNFEKKDQHEVDSLGEPYDYDSIMHYARNLFAKPGATETLRPRQCCPRPKIGHLSKPSAGDVRQMNKLYSCPSCGQTFLDNSATFASPNAQTSLSTAEASDGRHKLGISTYTLPFQGHAQSPPLQSATSDSLFCRWRIIAASGERIQLTFTHMDMLPPTNLSQSDKQKPAHSSSCVSEYVEVRDGYYSGSSVIGRYCGNNLPMMLISSSPRMLIEYTKSAGQGGTGFIATYKVVCGGIMQADDGIFSSPGYPNHYPPNRECTWRIEVPVGFAVFLTFYSFDLERGQNCPYDYLEIFDGPSVYSPRLGGICGVGLPNPIRSTNSTMTVRFVSDAKVQKQGFAARFQKVSYAETSHCTGNNHDCEQICVNTAGSYKCQCYDGYNLLPDKKTCEPVACGGYLRADKGNITSPANLITYSPNNKCIWRIEVSAGFSVQLSFDSFQFEEQSDCSSNYVEILDGPSDASPVLCKVCGSSLPAPITSTKNSMTVKFVSDGGLDNNRFTARFKKMISCVNYIKADNGDISSPDYPNNYPPNSNCIWRIEVPVGFSVLLTFKSFDLEEETDCRFDYLEIFDGSSECSPKLRRLCGSRIPTAVSSSKNTMTVKFTSDSQVHQKGFKANFKKVTYSEISQCAITNHGCEHLCVDIPGDYKCQCYDGYKLLPDEKSCQSLACGDYLRKGSGYITSPGFPKEYPPNSRCIWRIEVPSGFFVVLKFIRFELEDIFDCPYDYLEIYDGSLDPSSMLRKVCGTLIPEPVNSTSNVMTLKFVTDNAFHKKGFKVRHQIGVPPRKRFRSVGRH